MDVAMGLPTQLPHGREQELSWYRKIDEGPWSALATYDRFTFPGWALMVQLSAAAAATERVRLWTDIATLPARNPILFAKEIATVDVLSEGRVTLAVGIGAHDEDYQAVGASSAQRRQRMDEQVGVMQQVWSQVPPVAGHLPVGPTPVQPGGIPIVAGVKGPKALARAARWAAGVSDPTQTSQFDGDYLAAQRELVVTAWTEAGRDDVPHFSVPMWFALGPHPKEQLGAHAYDYTHVFGAERARQVAETTTNYGPHNLMRAYDGARAAGVDELRLIPTTADPDEIDRARDVLGI